MKHPIAERLNKLTASIDALKAQVREAMAGELAKAVGSAVRDVIIVVLCDQFAAASSAYRSVDSYEERDEWDDDDHRSDWRTPARPSTGPSIPPAAAVAVGVHVGRWLFRRKGSLPLSVGAGAVAAMLGLSGGPAARALLAVISASVDLLTADIDLDR